MTVKELIEVLNTFNLALEVVLECEHGSDTAHAILSAHVSGMGRVTIRGGTAFIDNSTPIDWDDDDE